MTALSSPRTIVVPLLFTRAFHAKVDVPAHLAEAREHCDLTLAEPLGTGPDIAETLYKRLRIDAPSASHATLFPVGTSDTAQAANYARLADNLARLAGVDVSVAHARAAAGCHSRNTPGPGPAAPVGLWAADHRPRGRRREPLPHRRKGRLNVQD